MVNTVTYTLWFAGNARANMQIRGKNLFSSVRFCVFLPKMATNLLESSVELINPVRSCSSCSVTKRRSYTREEKLEILSFAARSNIFQASKRYGVDGKNIRRWRDQLGNISDAPRGTRTKRGCAPILPIVEQRIYNIFQGRSIVMFFKHVLRGLTTKSLCSCRYLGPQYSSLFIFSKMPKHD